jgi:hypothetical protein
MDNQNPPWNIFSYLTPHDLCVTSRACKGWASVVDSDLTWQHHVPWVFYHY